MLLLLALCLLLRFPLLMDEEADTDKEGSHGRCIPRTGRQEGEGRNQGNKNRFDLEADLGRTSAFPVPACQRQPASPW